MSDSINIYDLPSITSIGDDDYLIAETTGETDKIKYKDAVKGVSHQTVEYTILSSGWSSKTYSLESVYPSTTYDILNVIPNQNTTDAQKKAWAKAQCGGYRTTNTIYAKGTVPSIDIIVELVIAKKYN